MYINSASSSALYAAYAIKTADVAVNRASERLSTGLRINSAADDPSGLAIANNFKKYIGSYNASLNNINDAISMNQVADKGLSAIYSNLSNMYTLALSSYGISTSDASTNTSSNQTLMDANNTAFLEYLDEIDSLAAAATFNGKPLLADDGSSDYTSGTNSYEYTIQAGVDSTESIDIKYYVSETDKLGKDKLDISGLEIGSDKSTTNLSTVLTNIKNAMDAISANQVVVSAQANILSTRADFVTNQIITNTQAYSNIMDANMAEESANLASAMIKRDAATAMLSQANTMNANIVKYLLQAYGS